MVRRSRIRAKMPGFVWGFTHTSGGKGKREGTRTAGHNQQRGSKRKDNEGRKRAREHTTSRQTKGRKSGEGRRRKRTEPNPGR